MACYQEKLNFQVQPNFRRSSSGFPGKSGPSGFTKMGVWNNPTFHPQMSGFSKHATKSVVAVDTVFFNYNNNHQTADGFRVLFWVYQEVLRTSFDIAFYKPLTDR